MSDLLRALLRTPGPVTISGIPDGLTALLLGDYARVLAASGQSKLVVHIASDDQRLAQIVDGLRFFAPDLAVASFPAWDCLPYDRVGPNPALVATRLSTLARLADENEAERPRIVVTTVNAALQRVPDRGTIAAGSWSAAPGHRISLDQLTVYLVQNGYVRVSTVRDPGDFALRGGIVDLFAPGSRSPVRLDLFGATLESIRGFDPQTQRTVSQLPRIDLLPASEVVLNEQTIRRFRSGYVARFGAAGGPDPLYEAITAGRRYQGMEHWLALFYEHLESLFDYLGPAVVTLDPLSDEARAGRLELISDYYGARRTALAQGALGAPPYHPVEPEALYFDDAHWSGALEGFVIRHLSPFEVPDAKDSKVVSLSGRAGRQFSAERAQENTNVFDALARHITALKDDGRRVLIACWSAGSRERLAGVLADHGVEGLRTVESWQDAQALPRSGVGLAMLGLEEGIETPDMAIIAEQDILGDRLARTTTKRRRDADFIAQLSSLSQGDLVVHIEHGIGRFDGLRAVDVLGAPHDCLLIIYHGGDKLFLPVENIELLSRYGSDSAQAQLDRLGGAGWQARKAKLKERIREMAGELIKTAAARALRAGVIMTPPDGIYDEFCARFPYAETDDQANAISDVIADLASGRPMDRLICGDVGFGKTEIALRSSFIVALAGRQTAIVVPSTLLARQHFETFQDRFRDLPVNIAQASRMVSTSTLAQVREGLASGEIDIVIGTHALLAKSIRFRDLGLVIIDEEQHFGVAHKERLKALKANVHVLTLTATPIPRTLQLALSGVRELSLIATPPVDRLAVRTFITPFDPVVLREALLREHYRGGQSFYVCPRISELAQAEQVVRTIVPEVKLAVAHGQMPRAELERIMAAFYGREFDVLMSTTIIESGLDIPNANTLIVHRADMYGLSQLYQLRGRVGRSKARAYAFFTTRPGKPLTAAAEKRLRALQSLDYLGAGFSLASHDLDIRGAGNLLGDEQSGHIREVGLELYQSMLEEAVAQLREGGADEDDHEQWSPQINIGTSVLIPEHYVGDLDLRLGLYRRLAHIEDAGDIDGFAAELIDRFGPLPAEVDHLLEIVAIKTLCRKAGICQVDAGPKGAVIAFHRDKFANPEGLIDIVTAKGADISLRPDHRLVCRRGWPSADDRLSGVKVLMNTLAALAAETRTATV